MGTSTGSSKATKSSISRYSGAGNLFLCADNRQGQWTLEPEAVQKMCERRACDGVLLAEGSTSADIRLTILNRDGSRAEMCGNGIRCFKRYLATLGLDAPSYFIETDAGIRKVWDEGECVGVDMGEAKILERSLTLDSGVHLTLIDTGVPHAIVFVDEIERAPVTTFGPHIRHHPALAPAGANVTFVQLEPAAIRTYERGVEGETLACGTGACAAAVAIAHRLGLEKIKIELAVRSGQSLHVSYDGKNLLMSGPALQA